MSEKTEITKENFTMKLENVGESDLTKLSKTISKKLLEDIDEYCITTYEEKFRWHLGASKIGAECSRYLWYLFRWCVASNFDGRMHRLFQRGHLEEARNVGFLKGIGCQVWTEDENGKQFKFSAHNGHFGGSVDGVVILPERFKVRFPLLCEFKTNGTGAGFNKLRESGMKLAKYEHFCQTSVYGSNGILGTKFSHCLYMNTNKNDDDMHLEVVTLDHNLGAQLTAKAERIIFADKAPPRLSDNPTFHKCQYCEAKEVCHKGKFAEKNCRSCENAKPVENAEWFCSLYNSVIPRDVVVTGCDKYITISKNG